MGMARIISIPQPMLVIPMIATVGEVLLGMGFTRKMCWGIVVKAEVKTVLRRLSSGEITRINGALVMGFQCVALSLLLFAFSLERSFNCPVNRKNINWRLVLVKAFPENDRTHLWFDFAIGTPVIKPQHFFVY